MGDGTLALNSKGMMYDLRNCQLQKTMRYGYYKGLSDNFFGGLKNGLLFTGWLFIGLLSRD
jgi:hypothetical protein